ncbi:MAG: replication-relaxation family protein [Candidatus Woesebacteria bacterium]
MHTDSITPTQTDILLYLYRYRFLSTLHIQHLLNHSNSSRISTWLKDLTEKKMVNRTYKRTTENTHRPAVYSLGLKSRQYLRSNAHCIPKLLTRAYTDKKRSLDFQYHWLFIADLYFQFLKATKEVGTTLEFYTTTDLEQFSYAPEPLPDGYVAISENGEIKRRYFIVVIDKKTPFFASKRKIDTYIQYYQERHWQDHYAFTFPTFLVICPNTKLKNHLVSFISKELRREEVEMNFFLGIHKDIQVRGIQADTWESVSD